MLVALVPPLGPRRLGRSHQRCPLAVEDVVGAIAGLEPPEPVDVDPDPF